jgi:subtilisin-like proprotein convertase family protein
MTLRVGEAQALKDLRVTVAIEHTFIRDLVVSIRPPTATGVPAIVLHNREGGATANLTKSCDLVSTPGLAALVGKSPAGTWTLIVSDKEAGDTGTIRSLSLAMRV